MVIVSKNKNAGGFKPLYGIAYSLCVLLVAFWFAAGIVDVSRFPRMSGNSPESGFAGIEVLLHRVPRWIVVYGPSLLAAFGLVMIRPRRDVRVGLGKVLLMMLCVMGTALGLGVQAVEINEEVVREALAAEGRKRGYAVIEDDYGRLWGIRIKTPKSPRRLGMLSQYPRLRALYASGNRISDADLSDLQYVGELEVLDLDHTDVTDAGLVHLASCKRLTTLRLGGCRVSDAGLDYIAELQNLEELYLYRTDVSDAGLDKLRKLGRLKSLRVDQTDVTPAGADRLREALPMVKIAID